jgi:hypothetical protein
LKGLAILVLLGFMVFTLILFLGSLTAGKTAWDTWAILAGVAVLEVMALIAVIRGD